MLLTFSMLYDKLISGEKLQTIRPDSKYYQKFVPGRKLDIWWRNPRHISMKRRAAAQGTLWDTHNGPYKMGLAECTVGERIHFTSREMSSHRLLELAQADGFKTFSDLQGALCDAWNLKEPWMIFENEEGGIIHWRRICWKWDKAPINAPYEMSLRDAEIIKTWRTSKAYSWRMIAGAFARLKNTDVYSPILEGNQGEGRELCNSAMKLLNDADNKEWLP